MEKNGLIKVSVFSLGFLLIFAAFVGIAYLLKQPPLIEPKREADDLAVEDGSRSSENEEAIKQPDIVDNIPTDYQKKESTKPVANTPTTQAPDQAPATNAPTTEKVAPQLSISDVENFVINNTNLFNLTPGYIWRSKRLGYIDYISSVNYYDSIGLYCSDPVERCFVAIIVNDGTGKPKYTGLSYEFLAPADATTFVWSKPNFTIGFSSGEVEDLQLIDGKIVHVEPRG